MTADTESEEPIRDALSVYEGFESQQCQRVTTLPSLILA